MPSTFAALVDQRRVAMQKGDVRPDTHLAQPAQHWGLTGLLPCSDFSSCNHYSCSLPALNMTPHATTLFL